MLPQNFSTLLLLSKSENFSFDETKEKQHNSFFPSWKNTLNTDCRAEKQGSKTETITLFNALPQRNVFGVVFI